MFCTATELFTHLHIHLYAYLHTHLHMRDPNSPLPILHHGQQLLLFSVHLLRPLLSTVIVGVGEGLTVTISISSNVYQYLFMWFLSTLKSSEKGPNLLPIIWGCLPFCWHCWVVRIFLIDRCELSRSLLDARLANTFFHSALSWQCPSACQVRCCLLPLLSEKRSCYVAQIGLESLGSNDLPASVSWASGTPGTGHHTWLWNAYEVWWICDLLLQCSSCHI